MCCVTSLSITKRIAHFSSKMAFYGSSRDAYTRNLEEAFRVRNASFSRYVSTLSRMQPMVELPLRPYRDEFFDLSYDPYGEEFDNEVDDRTLGSYVNTMVFNSALGVVDDRQCCGNGDENFEKGKTSTGFSTTRTM